MRRVGDRQRHRTDSPASQRRLEIARRIEELCPRRLVDEVAVTGSVSRGVATAKSDLELNFWTNSLPANAATGSQWLDEHLQWLTQNAGVSEFLVDKTPISDGSFWASMKFEGVWVETSWQRVDAQAKLIKELLAGQIVDHSLTVIADVLVNAVPIRTEGRLAAWKSELKHYPVTLQARLISDTIDSWTFPLHVDACWEANGESRLKFLEYLLRDIHGVLRIVFALNEVWEPDWKRLRIRVATLPVKPRGLIKRIAAILRDPSSRAARATCYELIMDTLALAPNKYHVTRASDVISRSLKRHLSS